MTRLEADLNFIQKNLRYANDSVGDVFRKYGDVKLKSYASISGTSFNVLLEGRTVYSYYCCDHPLQYDSKYEYKPTTTWHYDSPKIREAIAPAVRECSSAIHKRIEELKAKEEAHYKKVSDEKRAFEEKWGVGA